MKKPKIYCKKGYIIATAKETLKEFTSEYKVLKKTNISTSIGNIIIVEITKAGNALIGGPSSTLSMKKTIEILNKYRVNKIFIDGAFFRHSLVKISEATIYVVGANLTKNLDKIIQNAKNTVRKFKLKTINSDIINKLNLGNICMINDKNAVIDTGLNTLLGNENRIFETAFKGAKYLYIPTSLTNDFLDVLIRNRLKIKFDIILNSPVNIQLDSNNLNNLFKLKNNLFVINKINLVAVCINPYSPRGYEFKNDEFKERLEKELNISVFNVNEDK